MRNLYLLSFSTFLILTGLFERLILASSLCKFDACKYTPKNPSYNRVYDK